jgi:hypothetical protein
MFIDLSIIQQLYNFQRSTDSSKVDSGKLIMDNEIDLRRSQVVRTVQRHVIFDVDDFGLTGKASRSHSSAIM